MTSAPTLVRSSILTEYRRLALSLDLDPLDLMDRAGIDRHNLEDPELTLPMRAVVELLEITALSADIPDFGLRLAEARGLPDLGPVSLMLREQASVRDALRTLIALLHLHSNAVYMHLEEGEGTILTVDILTEGSVNCRQAIDTSVASATTILRWLLGNDWVPESICFTHSRPLWSARYDRFSRCPIDYLQEFNGIVLHIADLERSLPPSSPVLRRQVERYIHGLSLVSSQTYVHRVTQVVAMALPRGEARAQIIAQCLGTDCRTLHRRLARSGLNFSAVLHSVRRDAAVQHMLGSDRPLSDIAEVLGFESLSAFTRWFGKAFGCAPRTWRLRQSKSGRGRLS